MRKPTFESSSLSRLQHHLRCLHISEGWEMPKIESSGSPPPGVSEEEIVAVMVQKAPITPRDLINYFSERLKSQEEKDHFRAIVKKLAKLQQINGITHLILKQGFSTAIESLVPPTLDSTSLSGLRNHLQCLHISEGGEKSASPGSPPAVSEEVSMPVMVQKAPITSHDSINNSPRRFRSQEAKVSLAKSTRVLARLQARLQKLNAMRRLALGEGLSTPTTSPLPQNGVKSESKPSDAVSKKEVRAVLMEKSPITARDLVKSFPGRLKSKQEKDAFTAILRKMARIRKNNGISYIVPRKYGLDTKQ